MSKKQEMREYFKRNPGTINNLHQLAEVLGWRRVVQKQILDPETGKSIVDGDGKPVTRIVRYLNTKSTLRVARALKARITCMNYKDGSQYKIQAPIEALSPTYGA